VRKERDSCVHCYLSVVYRAERFPAPAPRYQQFTAHIFRDRTSRTGSRDAKVGFTNSPGEFKLVDFKTKLGDEVNDKNKEGLGE
jgi:hypothetical protein